MKSESSAQMGLDLRPMKDSLAKVYRLLIDAGTRGVSTGDFAEAYCTRYGARLGELRGLGMVIVKRKLDGASWRYWLGDYAPKDDKAA